MVRLTPRQDAVAAALRRVLERDGRPLVLTDRATGEPHRVSLDTAVAADGLLPVFLAAGEAVWKSATGHGFGLRVAEDRDALLGYRAAGVEDAPRSVVLLATMDAIKGLRNPEALPVNELNAVWREAVESAAEAAPGARPPRPAGPVKRAAAVATLAGLLLAATMTAPSRASDLRNSPVPVPAPDADTIVGCLRAAADAHGLPAPLLVVILRVEDGRLGRVVPNASGAPPDIGPMQVNAMWLPRIAARWHSDPRTAFLALRDNFCANVEAGAWIMRLALDRAEGDFWEGVASYHSATPKFRVRYLRLVLEQALRLEAMAAPAAAAP